MSEAFEFVQMSKSIFVKPSHICYLYQIFVIITFDSLQWNERNSYQWPKKLFNLLCGRFLCAVFLFWLALEQINKMLTDLKLHQRNKTETVIFLPNQDFANGNVAGHFPDLNPATRKISPKRRQCSLYTLLCIFIIRDNLLINCVLRSDQSY